MVLISHLVHYDILLQNATDIITRCVRFFIKNVKIFIQLATVTIKCVDFITKGNSYYKLRHMLQNRVFSAIISFKKN